MRLKVNLKKYKNFQKNSKTRNGPNTRTKKDN